MIICDFLDTTTFILSLDCYVVFLVLEYLDFYSHYNLSNDTV